MSALAQKRRGNEVQNQPTAKKLIKSVNYFLLLFTIIILVL